MRPLLLLLLIGAQAQAQPFEDGVYRCTREERASAQTIRIGTANVRLGARLSASEPLVSATQNDNARFHASVSWPRRGECGEAALRLGGDWVLNSSYGSDQERCSAEWVLDPAPAAQAAALFHVTRQDRHPIGERLTATFEPSVRVVRAGQPTGQPIAIIVTIANPAGAPRVHRLEGGSNRGPRDNQFEFQIMRDGQALTPIDGPDYGGRAQYVSIAPGSSGQVRTELAPWGDVSIRGHYEVRCSYRVVLLGERLLPHPSEGQVWDRRFEGVVHFEVQ